MNQVVSRSEVKLDVTVIRSKSDSGHRLKIGFNFVGIFSHLKLNYYVYLTSGEGPE